MKRTGFTFLEVLIVLLVVGLLTATSVPAFKRFCENTRLKAGARLTLNLLRQARSEAITNHRTTCLVFPYDDDPDEDDPWKNLYYKGMKIVYLKGTLYDGTEVYRTLSGWEYLPKGLKIDSSSSVFNSLDTIEIPYPYDDSEEPLLEVGCVKFKPNGEAARAGTIRIEQENDSSEYKNVTYILSGRAKME